MPLSTDRQPPLRLARGVRIERASSGDLHVLRHPAGVIALNPTAAAILRLCDGHHSRADVTKCVGADPLHINAFLDAACKRAWITEDASHFRMH